MVDTIWVFEKEEDKLLDDSPAYEGVIIEYLHKVKVNIIEPEPIYEPKLLNIYSDLFK